MTPPFRGSINCSNSRMKLICMAIVAPQNAGLRIVFHAFPRAFRWHNLHNDLPLCIHNRLAHDPQPWHLGCSGVSSLGSANSSKLIAFPPSLLAPVPLAFRARNNARTHLKLPVIKDLDGVSRFVRTFECVDYPTASVWFVTLGATLTTAHVTNTSA